MAISLILLRYNKTSGFNCNPIAPSLRNIIIAFHSEQNCWTEVILTVASEGYTAGNHFSLPVPLILTEWLPAVSIVSEVSYKNLNHYVQK